MDTDLKLCKNCKFFTPDMSYAVVAAFLSFLGIVAFSIAAFGKAIPFPVEVVFFLASTGLAIGAYKIFNFRYQFAYCRRTKEIDFVTGKDVYRKTYCSTQRKYDCGSEARYFEQK